MYDPGNKDDCCGSVVVCQGRETHEILPMLYPEQDLYNDNTAYMSTLIGKSSKTLHSENLQES